MNTSRPFVIVTGDFVRTGGMDRSNYHLADFIARQRHSVHLVSHEVEPTLLARSNVFWHKAMRPLNSNLIGEHTLRRLAYKIASTKGFEDCLSIVNGGNCSLPTYNWVHYVHAAFQPRNESNALQKIKTSLSHQHFLSEEAKAFRLARVIIANSNRTKSDLIKHYGTHESRIHVIYYGSSAESIFPTDANTKTRLRDTLHLPTDKFLFVFIGALGDRRKGFDTLFSAWTNCGPSLWRSAELIVVGQGSELPTWEAKARSLSSSGGIRFLGFRKDVPDVLKACDALIAPTRYEAFGLAVLEALCCGLPAIVSRRAGVAERFPLSLSSLLLDDPENVHDLSSKILFVHANHSDLRKPARELSEEMRAYTWDDMGRTFYRLFEANA